MKLDINAKDIHVNYITLNQLVVFRIIEKIKSVIILLKIINMKARVRKRIYNNVNFFVVEIKHGYQKFDLALKSHTNKTS